MVPRDGLGTGVRHEPGREQPYQVGGPGGRVSQPVQPQGAKAVAINMNTNATDTALEYEARLALVSEEIDFLLARLADLRAVRLRQLADAQAR